MNFCDFLAAILNFYENYRHFYMLQRTKHYHSDCIMIFCSLICHPSCTMWPLSCLKGNKIKVGGAGFTSPVKRQGGTGKIIPSHHDVKQGLNYQKMQKNQFAQSLWAKGVKPYTIYPTNTFVLISCK